VLKKGDKFNSLTVDSLVSDNTNMKKRLYKCICDCGNEVVVNEHSLVHHFKTSCGCAKSIKFRKAAYDDLIDKDFGKLTVVGIEDKRDDNRIYMKCRCNLCGKIISKSVYTLRNNTNPNLMCSDCYRTHTQLRADFKDITNNRYGKLVVDSFAYSSLVIVGTKR
jgi:hypothetical protein